MILQSKDYEQFKLDSANGCLNGKYLGVPSEVYHASDGISSSNLKAINKSILHYIYTKEHPKQSDALSFGSMFHDSILLPDEFALKYAKGPDLPKNTKEGKAAWSEFIEANKDKTIVKADEYDQCIEMRDRLLNIEAVQFILSQGEPEVSYYWTDEESGILCKLRTDWIRENDIIVTDLKTTNDDSGRNGFLKDVVAWDYDLSAAFYLDGLSCIYKTAFKTFTYIVIEKKPPYDVGLYVLGDESIEIGRKLYRQALNKYVEYIKRPNKKEYEPKEFEKLDLPSWALDINRR